MAPSFLSLPGDMFRSMICLGCRNWSRAVVCSRCSRRSTRGGSQRLASGLLVRSAFAHEGAPRDLVHRLKFEGLLPAAHWLAGQMTPLVLGVPGVLVPVPRTGARRLRFGVDTGLALALALGKLTGRPVERLLRAPVWARGHTGRDSARRQPPIFFSRSSNVPILLVDDVITTGSTLQAAAMRLDGMAVGAVTATRTLRVTSLLGEEIPGSFNRRELPDRR